VLKASTKLVASLTLLSSLIAACDGGSKGAGTGGNGGGTAANTSVGGTETGTGGTAGTGGSGTSTGGTPGSAGTTAPGSGGTTAPGSGGTTAPGSGGTTSGAGASTGGTAGTAGSGAGAGGVAGMAVSSGGAAVTLGPAGAPPACQAPGAISGMPGSVDVALSMTVQASVSADLMGVHTSVYDGNMQLATTPNLLQAAGVKSLRYPGGSYADLYHWSLHKGTYTPANGSGSNTIYVAPDTHFGAFLTFMEKVGANALITVDYGMNSLGTGGGEPKEAAAWVAYANGSTSSTVTIGMDSKGTDWNTVAFWANLRASAPIATDDGYNMFRISHPNPFGVKYWEVGNELYGNGYYYGSCGWEADMHVAYPASGTCSDRQNNAALSPAAYGTGVKAFSEAMKAVDSTIKIGGIVVAHSDSEYADWNSMALPNACASMDFASVHWYAGTSLATLPEVPLTEVPKMFQRAHTATGTASYNCPGGANMPVAITEWGPNTNTDLVKIPMSTATAAPAGSQLIGLFAADAYGSFMDQGALAAHWLELHNGSYLAGIDAMNDPFTTVNDSPRWGYHAAQLAHFLATGGDKMVKATTSATGFGAQVRSHASVHANGDIAVMLTNISNTDDAAMTVNVAGGTLGCVGTRYAYTPVNGDQDGSLSADWIFASSGGTAVTVLVPKYSSVVVVFPPK
jgi:hypothetical protein